MRVKDFWEGEAELNSYWRIPMKEGMVIRLGHWMQFVPARVQGASKGGDHRRPVLSIRAKKPLVYPSGARARITHLEGRKLRVAGTLPRS